MTKPNTPKTRQQIAEERNQLLKKQQRGGLSDDDKDRLYALTVEHSAAHALSEEG